MYGSPATAKDPVLSFSHNNQHNQRKEEMSLPSTTQQGLQRYRSAPSSLFGEVCDDFLPLGPPRPPSSPDAADTMLARFLSSGSQFPPPQPPPVLQVSRAEESHTMFYHHRQNQQHPPQHEMQNQAKQSHSVAMETAVDGSGCPTLIRQSSSPAGLFSRLNVENGNGLMRSMSGGPNGTGSIEEAGGRTPAPEGRLRSQLSYSSRQGSLMSQMSEMRSKGMGCSGPEESSGGGGRCYIPGYPIGSWDDSQVLEDNFSESKQARDPGLHQSDLQVQIGEIRNSPAGLAHQFSLPNTSSEMAAMEKFFQFQDAVPCKVRAKRGCATHPRSIAERVRRTRISERMRKLQELVPNMDKQTNTADMLDLAVDYIKDLQEQFKSLSDDRARCTCSGNRKPDNEPS